ncbi:MAG TPA: hypothetical protein VGJ91_24470 [Polyangiaceae bacterium]
MALVGGLACSGKTLNELGEVSHGGSAGSASTAGDPSASGGNAATAGTLAEPGGAPTAGAGGAVGKAGGPNGVAGSEASSAAGVAGSDYSGPNLIRNGDFSAPNSGWTISDYGATPNPPDPVEAPTSNGELCATVSAGSSFVVLGWPLDLSQAVVVIAGRRYELSYDVRGSGNLAVSVNAKVGHAVMPFTEDLSYRDDVTTDGVTKKVSYTSILTVGDNQAGVALELSNVSGSNGDETSTICFDNISLSEVKPPP